MTTIKIDKAQIPKQASLYLRGWDAITKILHAVFGRDYQYHRQYRANNWIVQVYDLKDKTSLTPTDAKLYYRRAAEFLNDFRTRIASISTNSSDQALNQALDILHETADLIHFSNLVGNDHYDYVIETLYDEFFDFASKLHRNEAARTARIENIDTICQTIFDKMKDLRFKDTSEVEGYFRKRLVKQLPTFLDLCDAKTETILKDAENLSTILELSGKIFPLEKRLLGAEGAEKTELENQLIPLYEKRHVELVDFYKQFNDYRVNLLKLGVPLSGQVHKQQLSELEEYQNLIKEAKIAEDFRDELAAKLDPKQITNLKQQIESYAQKAFEHDPAAFTGCQTPSDRTLRFKHLLIDDHLLKDPAWQIHFKNRKKAFREKVEALALSYTDPEKKERDIQAFINRFDPHLLPDDPIPFWQTTQ